MADKKIPTTETVTSLAARVGIETTPERAEQIREEIGGGIDGYAGLLEGSDRWAPTVDRNRSVIHYPDEDADLYNAFVSVFELAGDTGPLDDLTMTLKDNIAVGAFR